jgi:hypothetical protein
VQPKFDFAVGNGLSCIVQHQIDSHCKA